MGLRAFVFPCKPFQDPRPDWRHFGPSKALQAENIFSDTELGLHACTSLPSVEAGCTDGGGGSDEKRVARTVNCI